MTLDPVAAGIHLVRAFPICVCWKPLFMMPLVLSCAEHFYGRSAGRTMESSVVTYKGKKCKRYIIINGYSLE